MSSRADTILRIAKTRGAQTLSSEIGLLSVVWSMRVSGRWQAALLHMDIVEGWIIGTAIDKTFAPAQKKLRQSQWQLALAEEAFGRPIGESCFPGGNRVTAGRAGGDGKIDPPTVRDPVAPRNGRRRSYRRRRCRHAQ